MSKASKKKRQNVRRAEQRIRKKLRTRLAREKLKRAQVISGIREMRNKFKQLKLKSVKLNQTTISTKTSVWSRFKMVGERQVDGSTSGAPTKRQMGRKVFDGDQLRRSILSRIVVEKMPRPEPIPPARIILPKFSSKKKEVEPSSALPLPSIVVNRSPSHQLHPSLTPWVRVDKQPILIIHAPIDNEL